MVYDSQFPTRGEQILPACVAINLFTFLFVSTLSLLPIFSSASSAAAAATIGPHHRLSVEGDQGFKK